MAFTKFASYEVSEVLDIKGSATRQRTASLNKLADFEDYRTEDGYLYARIRAISSRVNKNYDGWPAIELAGSPEIFAQHRSAAGGFTVEAANGNQKQGFATFVGKPIFVDHNNTDPKKARGVIVDAKLNVLDHKTAAKDDDYWGGHDVDKEHMPPTEVELLLEVDAKTFPRLADAIVSGDLDGFSMGCDVEYSKCSHCGNKASSPDEYCSHIVMKGGTHDFKTADGQRVSKKSYENCYGIHFFEISAVFDPADETALAREVRSAVHKEAELYDGSPAGIESGPDPIRGGQDAWVQQYAAYLEQQGMSPEQDLTMAQHRVGDHAMDNIGNDGAATPSMMFPGEFQQMPHGMDPGQQHNDPRWSSTHLAENPLPQDFQVRAPDEVDTLRAEQLCPICGNEMDSETCSVCGYVTPPKEFDNPDLDKAQQIRDEMKQQDEAQSTPGESTPQPQPGPDGSPGPAPATNSPTKPPATAKVTSEMWRTFVHPKTAARINQVEVPIRPASTPSSDEPSTETVTSDQTRPVTAARAMTPAMRTAQQLIANAQRNHTGDNMHRQADGPTPPGDTSPYKRVNVTDIGGVDEASNEEASRTNNPPGKTGPGQYKQVDVTGIGGTGVEDVSADSTESLPTAAQSSDDAGFNTNKTTDDSGPTKTFGDKDGQESGVTDPVTNESLEGHEQQGSNANREKATLSHQHRAYDDGTLEQNEQQGNKPVAQGGSAVKGVQPVAETFGTRENVLEHKTSPENNSGRTDTWSGTNGNGVTKQQDPVTRDRQEWGGVPVPDVKLHTNAKAHFVAAIRLAEAEQELGLITNDEKWNRIAELDAQSHEAVTAQIQALARVKTAGLAKLAAHRQSSVRSLPKAFGKSTAAPEGFERIASEKTAERQTVSDDVLDSALFY
jgi:hypothetical protein